MGTVSGGTATLTNKAPHDVVIKEPIGAGPARERNTRALRSEAIVWQELHPKGVALLVEGKDGSVTLVVDRVKGPSLDTLLEQDERFSEKPAKRDGKLPDVVAMAVAHSLRPFQQAKLVHGDINPKNVHVDIDGKTASARLIDFGLTKRADTAGDHSVNGSPGYMGVEASLGRVHTEHRDVHAMQQTLLRLYYRDFYARIGEPNTPNTARRGYAGFFEKPEMHRTMEDGSFGVKPQIAWLLRLSAIRKTKDFVQLLDKAQRSTDMHDFLGDLAPSFVETWRRGDPEERESLLVDLVRSPKFRTAFAAKLPPDVQKELLAMLISHEGKQSGIMFPYKLYEELMPMIGEFHKEFQRSQMSGLARLFSGLRFR